MKATRSILAFLIIVQALFITCPFAAAAPPQGVINCHTSWPTRDKPQSKVWFAQGSWWAWLPEGDEMGSRIWRRGGDGAWQAQENLDPALKNLPGRADVWASEDGGKVVAALVGKNLLAVAALRYNPSTGGYELEGEPLCWQEDQPVETVTIDRCAGDGSFWTAYPVDTGEGRSIVARNVSPQLLSPGKRITLYSGLYKDEVCAVTSLGRGLGVMWSDQAGERVFFARHKAHAANSLWEPVEIVVQGNKCADDHINFCQPAEKSGLKLVAATKTSLDSLGETILALQVLTSEDRWFTVDFAELTDQEHPSRPVVLWLGSRAVVLYTVYGTPGLEHDMNRILAWDFSPDATAPVGVPRVIIPPVRDLNNVTGPKRTPPGVQPVLVIASDREGRVYEGLIGP